MGRTRIAMLVVAALTSAAVWVGLPTGPASAHVPHDRITTAVASPAYATDGTVFVVSRNHLMRSVDGGSSWNEIVRGITGAPSGLAFAPSDARTLYLSVSGVGILRSRDQGSSWTRTSTALTATRNIRDLAVSPRSPAVAFATGKASGLYRTTDTGAHWAAVGSLGVVTAMTVASSGRLIIGGGNGTVFVSDDDGTTWTQSAGIGGAGAVTAIASTGTTVALGTRSGRAFRSDNGGASFTAIGSGLPAEEVTSITLSPDFANDRSVWAATYSSGVYRSTDRGARFTKKSKGLSTNPQAELYELPQFLDVVVAKADDGHLVLLEAGYDGLFRSDDRAVNWVQIQTLADYVVGLAVSPDYRNDGTVIATTYVKGAYLSTDRGATFEGRHVGLGFADGQNAVAPIYRMTNPRFSPNYVNDGTIFSAGFTSLLKSTDRGSSWTALPVLPPSATQQLFVVAVSPSYATDRTVFVGSTFGRLFRSTAGGAGPWAQLGAVDGKFQSLLLSPRFPTDRVMFAGTSEGLFKSVNAGSTWTKTSAPSGPTTLTMSPNYPVDGTLFAGTGNGLLVSRDRGSTWTKLSAPPLSTSSHIEAVGVSPEYATDRMVLVSVAGKGLYRSDDGGASFAQTGASLLDQNLLIADFDNPTAAPIQFSPDFAVDHTIFAIAQTRIVKSTDSGATWQAVDLPPVAALLEDPVITPAPTTATVSEGDSGDQVLRVAFDLSHPFRSTVTVNWQTVDAPDRPDVASAAAGDYVAASGQLTYLEGETRHFVEIVIHGDTQVELDEQVLIELHDSSPNSTIATSPGFGIIEDDDA